MSSEELEKTNADVVEARVCVICGKHYPSGMICPDDGGLLSPIQADALIGAKFADRYQILSLVGRGGMSSVYKAQHLFMDRFAAIKVLVTADIISLKRFQLEANLVSNLAHPNIVTVFDFGVSDKGQPYLVMDFLDGKTLAAFVAEHGAMETKRAVAIFRQACDALAYAHKRELIHRDLKPSNFILIQDESGGDFLKLVDFGIAKVMSGEREGLDLTKTGEVFGSPLYMSPEQCQGKELDARADIYSMGCVMFEVLTGIPPFVGSNALETIQKHINEKAPPLLRVSTTIPAAPPELERIVLKCLDREPANRYQDVTALWHDLNEFFAKIDLSAPSPDTAGRGEPPASILSQATTSFDIATPNKVPVADKIESNLLPPIVAPNEGRKEPGSNPPNQMSRGTAAVVACLIIVGTIALFIVAGKKPAPGLDVSKVNSEFKLYKEEGEKQFSQSRLTEATRDFELAAKVAENFDSNDPRLATTLNDLGNVYYKRDMYPQAEENLKRALQLRINVFGENSRPAADSMTDLGGLYCAEDKISEAKDYLDKSFSIRAKNSGMESEDYADSLKALAVLDNKNGKIDDAMVKLHRALQIRTHNLGPTDPEVAETQLSLALDYQLKGDFARADELYKQAQAIAQSTNGGASTLLLSDSLVGQGTILFVRKKYAQAETDFLQALTIRETSLGADSLRTGEALSCLAVLKTAEGKNREAAAYSRRALNNKAAALGRTHPDVQRTARRYRDLLNKLNRGAEARQIAQQYQITQ